MPALSALDILEWLQANPVPEMKIAVFADSSGPAIRLRALELGASYFFSKGAGDDEEGRA